MNLEKQPFWIQAVLVALLVAFADKGFNLGIMRFLQEMFKVGGSMWFLLLIVCIILLMYFGEVLGLLRSKGKGVRKSYSFKR